MTTQDARTFIGLPVCDHHRRRHDIPQRPIGVLQDLVGAVRADPAVYAFGWRHRTYRGFAVRPMFTLDNLWFALTPRPGLPDLGRVDMNHIERVGAASCAPEDDQPASDDDRDDIGDDPATFERLAAVRDALTSGAFDTALLVALGTHVAVNISSQSMSVRHGSL
ncbi:hypothetical protein [Embleya sp. NPDC059237]|uniref:hypothetical protein n=1 Tax=Embleya sp. NPDC059237 TaxID=3346784 RepID=UPI003675D8CE